MQHALHVYYHSYCKDLDFIYKFKYVSATDSYIKKAVNIRER